MPVAMLDNLKLSIRSPVYRSTKLW